MGLIFLAVTVAYEDVGEGREQEAEASPAGMLAPSLQGCIHGVSRQEISNSCLPLAKCDYETALDHFFGGIDLSSDYFLNHTPQHIKRTDVHDFPRRVNAKRSNNQHAQYRPGQPHPIMEKEVLFKNLFL
mgnify:CR=1 FL=1